jgi:hypothetical protein
MLNKSFVGYAMQYISSFDTLNLYSLIKKFGSIKFIDASFSFSTDVAWLVVFVLIKLLKLTKYFYNNIIYTYNLCYLFLFFN